MNDVKAEYIGGPLLARAFERRCQNTIGMSAFWQQGAREKPSSSPLSLWPPARRVTLS